MKSQNDQEEEVHECCIESTKQTERQEKEFADMRSKFIEESWKPLISGKRNFFHEWDDFKKYVSETKKFELDPMQLEFEGLQKHENDDNKDQNEQIKVTAEQLREERAKLLARCFSLSCIFRVVRSAT